MDIIQMTDSGIVSTNRDTIFQNLMSKFKAIYGTNVYIDKGTEDYNMISLLADLLSDMGNVAVSAGNGLSLTNAVGIQLDNLASIYYGTFNRKPATHSTVIITITGIPNVNIYNGQVRDNYGGVWNLPQLVTIPNAGTINVVATYSETGAYYISANQISGKECIATPVAGWNNVSQPGECVIGRNVETDAEFRVRIAQRSKGSASGTLNALRSNLLALRVGSETPIQEIRIYENDTSDPSSSIASGITIPGHSLAIIVYPGAGIVVDSDLSKAIAKTILDYKSSGVGTTGTISQNLSNSEGQVMTVKYTPAVTQTFTIDIKLRKLTTIAPDLTIEAIETIQNAVADKLSTYTIGSTVYAQDFYTVVTNAMAKVLDLTQYNINEILLSSGESEEQTSVSLDYNAKAIIENPSEDIEITTI